MEHRDAFNEIITFGFIQKAKSFLPEAENLPGIFGGGHFTKAKELAGQASKVRGAGDRIGAMSRIAQARKEVYKGKIEAGVAGLGVAGSAATLGGTAYAVAHARKKQFKAELRDIIEFARGDRIAKFWDIPQANFIKGTRNAQYAARETARTRSSYGRAAGYAKGMFGQSRTRGVIKAKITQQNNKTSEYLVPAYKPRVELSAIIHRL